MNKFLNEQLEKKVEKFFADKDDLFVVYVNSWLSFGNGPVDGPPDTAFVPKEDFDFLVKEIVGEKTLGNLVSDMIGENTYLTALSLTERSHLTHLNQLFLAECYHRLRKRTLNERIAANEKFIKKCNTKLKKINEEIQKTLSTIDQKTTFHEKNIDRF